MVEIDYPDSDRDDNVFQSLGNDVYQAAPRQGFFSVLEDAVTDLQLADSISAMEIDQPVCTWEEYHITAIATSKFPEVSEFRRTHPPMLEMVYKLLNKRFPIGEYWYDRVGHKNVRVFRARTRKDNRVCGVVLVEKVEVMWSKEKRQLVRADGNPCWV